MAVPVARVHLKMAHAALPALLPTPPPKCNMLPLLPSPPPCAAGIFPKPLAVKPGRADSDERWDAHKKSATSDSSSSHLPTSADRVRSCAGRGSSSRRKSATSPAPMLGRADSAERWDARKKAANPASSSSSSSGTSSLASSSKWPISRVSSSSADRWDAHKEHRPPRAELVDDGASSSTGSNDDDLDTDEEEEILWKPRAMYAGPGFAAAAPETILLPMPTAFVVPVA